MNRYVIKFIKEGYIKYTSHLDMLRLFKRALKKSGIRLSYSQGFNPHPKMGFAQPLSLGYTSRCELLEFETTEALDPEEIQHRIGALMPQGVTILYCKRLLDDVKSLAATVTEAEYLVTFPAAADPEKDGQTVAAYLAQDVILAEKRQKKTRKMVEVDIRPKIRDIQTVPGERLTLMLRLDSGSTSNLSPEQVITTFNRFAHLGAERYDIQVERRNLIFAGGILF